MSGILEHLLILVDFNMPWILPSLEVIDQIFPFSLRLLIGVVLTLWLVWSRQRQDHRWSQPHTFMP